MSLTRPHYSWCSDCANSEA